MSILVYHDGIIAADSRGVIDRDGWALRTTAMLKLFKGDVGVVMGMIGENRSISHSTKEFIFFRNLIEEMESLKEFTRPLKEELVGKYGAKGDRNLCFMTRRHFYIVSDTEIFAVIDGVPQIFGTGMRTAMMSLARGDGVVRAVHNAIEMCPECGGTVLSFTQKELEFIPRKRKSK